MSHKQAKRERKLYPHLSSKHRREQDRLRSEAVSKIVKAVPLEPTQQPLLTAEAAPTSSTYRRLQVAALLASLGMHR